MGKGATPEQAEASAVMELAERFSFFSFIRNPSHFFQSPFAGVREHALPFEMIARSVHDASEDLPISRRIFETLSFQWTWAFNLTRGHAVMIPFDWFLPLTSSMALGRQLQGGGHFAGHLRNRRAPRVVHHQP